MSARKLGRLAGLVFVLVVAFGGASVGAFTADKTTAAAVLSTTNFEWN
jgi:hypothetical protein